MTTQGMNLSFHFSAEGEYSFLVTGDLPGGRDGAGHLPTLVDPEPSEAGTEGTAREVRFMLRIWVHRVRPDKEARLRTWLAELNMRAGEVRESFRIAGIRAEQAALVSSGDGPLLVYVSDAEDQRQAAQAFEESQSAIDAEHRRVLAECIEETLDATPLYDVAG